MKEIAPPSLQVFPGNERLSLDAVTLPASWSRW